MIQLNQEIEICLYWNYEPFGLDELSDDECQEEFRFLKNDIYLLHEMLGIPDDIVCYNGTSVDGIIVNRKDG